MSKTPALDLNPDYLEGLYTQWKEDPGSLDPSWQFFFQGFDLAGKGRPEAKAVAEQSCTSVELARDQSRVASLIYNYRDQGYRIAHTNPLQEPDGQLPDLALENFGFSEEDRERIFNTGHLAGPQQATLQEILQILRQTYCGHLGVEYLHINDMNIRRWMQAQMEPHRNQPSMDAERKREILEQLVDAELLETFIHRHYLGQKRFSLEGGETLIPLVHAIIELAPELGADEIVLGMSHRGRLNVLANLLDKSYATIFSEFEDNFLEHSVAGDGDVKYHKGFSSDHQNRNSKRVHLSLTANPSHLEAVGPVVLGRARAKQRQRGDAEERRKVLPLLVHGDAAFAGQGVVAETFNLSRLEGYSAGGTVHVVLNNQIGFTTLPGEARSSLNATDVAKMVGAPILHVNGDDPEAAVYAAELALRFRQEFGRDVVVELVCYRRHGHSEIDEPRLTQPRLYRDINDHPSVRKIYTDQLIQQGELTPQQEEAMASGFQTRLEQAYEQAHERPARLEETSDQNRWRGHLEPYSHAPVATGVEPELLQQVTQALATVPEGFALNPKVKRLAQARLKAAQEGGSVDWSHAESLALGSLLLEGIPVRLSGQDCERGTFSQRHAVLRHLDTEVPHVPLNHLREGQARLCVYNSPLSEASVLGFDYGYALTEPRMLVLWEAQFGDFANGAQVIIDQFIVAAQAKWDRSNGITLLLPHGYEGQGPEHSNAYLERYLAAGAEQNIQVCVPSTPAQYFHVLRRQMKQSFRRPLLLLTPKSLLRLPAAVSPLESLTLGSKFEEVLSDESPPQQARRLVFCSGKVYYDLLKDREPEQGVALARVEQLYPLWSQRLRKEIERYPLLEELVWAQEEPKNRGAWSFIQPRLQSLFPDLPLRYAGRPASASPATGSLKQHRSEQAALVQQALGGASPQDNHPSSRGEPR